MTQFSKTWKELNYESWTWLKSIMLVGALLGFTFIVNLILYLI